MVLVGMEQDQGDDEDGEDGDRGDPDDSMEGDQEGGTDGGGEGGHLPIKKRKRRRRDARPPAGLPRVGSQAQAAATTTSTTATAVRAMEVVEDDEEAEVNFWPSASPNVTTTAPVTATTATKTMGPGETAFKTIDAANNGGGAGDSGTKSGRGGGASGAPTATVYDWETRRLSRKKAREDALVTQVSCQTIPDHSSLSVCCSFL